METINILRISTIFTFLLFLAALITPAASIAVNLSGGPDAAKYLEFVCVYCQYGSTSNNPFGTAIILNLTPFDFYFMWIPVLLLTLVTFVSVLWSFQIPFLRKWISAKSAMSFLWFATALALSTRGLYSILLRILVTDYQKQFPNNQIIGELSWSAGALVIGAIMAATSAMIGFIEFQYEVEEEGYKA